MKVNKELIKGSAIILILSLLEQKEMYGYEMIKEIERKSNNIFIFKEPSYTKFCILLRMKNLLSPIGMMVIAAEREIIIKDFQ